MIELVLVLVIFVAFAIRTSWFQTYLAQQAANYLSKELGTEVAIEKVDIVFFDLVDIEGVFLEDIQKDTLLSAETIRIDINELNLTESFVIIDEVILSDASANIMKYQGDSAFNFQHIIDYFATDKIDTTSSTPFGVSANALSLENVNFKYHDQNAKPIERGLDYSHVDLKSINGTFSEFEINDKVITVNLEHLSLEDKSGLAVKELSSNITYSPNLIGLDHLQLGFNNSVIQSDSFNLILPNGTEDFSNFVENVQFSGNVRNSVVEMEDVALFTSALYGMDTKVNLHNIELKGPISGMKLPNTHISMLEETEIVGDFMIPKLDSISQAFIDEKVIRLRTSYSDISHLKLTPFLGGPDYLELPSDLAAMGTVLLRDGHFTGFLNDFEVDGNVISGIGNISSEYGIKFKQNPTTGIYSYHGVGEKSNSRDVIVENLDLGAISGNKTLGKTTGYLSINKGSSGFSMDQINLLFKGRFESIVLNDYNYHNVQIKKGKFANDRFEGVVDLSDDNLALNYDGFVDFKGDLWFDFDVKIDSAKINEILARNKELKSILKTKISVNLKGSNLDDIRGNIKVGGLSYVDKKTDFSLDSLTLNIERSDSTDQVALRSELIDIDLAGKFDFTDMWPVVQHQLHRVADHLIDDVDISKSKNKYFDLTVNMKDINPFLQFIDSEIEVAEESKLIATYDLDKLKLVADFKSDYVSYEGMEFSEIHLKNYFDSLRANLQYQAENVKINDSLEVNNAAVFSYVKNNEFSTNVGWDKSEKVEPALFAFNTHLLENQDILTEFKPSFFFLKNHRWNVSPDSKILYNKELVEFSDFKVKNGDHEVSLDGKVSKNPDDWLYFSVRDFDLTDLNGILGGETELGGILNVEGGVADVYDNIRFMSLADVKGFMVEGEPVGDILLDSKWNKEKESVSLDGYLKREGKETFRFTGNYFTALDKNNVELDLIFDYTNIAFLNAFADPDLYMDIEGLIDGKLEIRGELTNPVITGELDVITADFLVPMFNVNFGISGLIKFEDGKFYSNDLSIYDEEGNLSRATMNIRHDDWVKWAYNVRMDMNNETKKFLVMNTEYKEGDLYYGKAYVTGDVNINGKDDLTEIGVNATTQEGTDLKLAMYGNSDLEESSFIIFDTIVPRASADQLNDNSAQLETLGLILKMNFDITKNTKATIIFDPLYGDQIEVEKGEGNLSINMDEYGEMDMYGKYTILEGRYAMRVQGIFSRDLLLAENSTLQWTKSPYDALIDIDAYYETKVSLDPILPTGIDDRREEKRIVKANIHMGKTLMNPSIDFMLSSPDASDLEKAALRSIQADKDHLNKQFFSVLALNRFLPTHGFGGGNGNALLNGVEGQLNTILENVGENYDLNAELEEGRTELGFETQVGEKITIKTSLGVVSGDEESAGGIIGDVSVEYRLNEDGSFTVNAFNESNQGSDAEKGPFTQGVGLHYEETFNTAEEFRLLQGFLNIFRRKSKKVDYKTARDNGKRVPIEGAREKLEEEQRKRKEAEQNN